MVDTEYLDLEQLVKNCMINLTDDSNAIIEAIAKVERELPKSDAVRVINHFFETTNNFDVMKYLLREINIARSQTSVQPLVEALVMKDKFKEVPTVNEVMKNPIQKALLTTLSLIDSELRNISPISSNSFWLLLKFEKFDKFEKVEAVLRVVDGEL